MIDGLRRQSVDPAEVFVFLYHGALLLGFLPPPTARSGSPLPAERGTAARVHLGSSGCLKQCAGLCSCVLKRVPPMPGAPRPADEFK